MTSNASLEPTALRYGAAECAARRADFPALERQVAGRPAAFLDGPAGTQVPRAVIDAVSAYYERSNANGGGRFVTSEETDELLDSTRETVAAFLGAAGGETISFGQNMTTLTFSLARAIAPLLSPGDEVVVTQLDHEANRGPWLGLERQGVTVREIGVGRDGRLVASDFERVIGPRTRLVAMGSASNALGTVNDVARARELSREVGAWLSVDAVHHAAHFPQDVAALDPDFLACSAYKFYGPHVGLLYSRPGLLDELETERLRTQKASAPDKIETGTLNHAAIAGVKAAIEYLAGIAGGPSEGSLRERLVTVQSAIAVWEHGVARRYAERVGGIPGVTVWGPPFEDGEERAPTVSITVDGVPAAEVARRLGEEGLFVWDGHFYAARPVEVLGLAERGGLVRTGIAMYNTPQEVDRLLEAVARVAAEG